MRNDGGPAFPFLIPSDVNDDYSNEFSGMSLRDWFAGMALNGYIASLEPGETFNESSVASDCYSLADAMLTVRER